MAIGGYKTLRLDLWLFVCSTVWTFFYIFGLSMGTPTVAIPQLKKHTNSTEEISDEMSSWIASINGYSATGLVVVLIFISHYYGRKKCLLLLAVNSTGASILLYNSFSAEHILICEAMYGLTLGAQMSILLMVVTEYTSAEYRGIFLTLKSASTFWGIWTANAIGIFTDYNYIGLLAILCSVYNLIAIIFIPESPYWLVSKGQYEECARVHRWLKGDGENAENELTTLITTQMEVLKNKVKKTLTANMGKYYRNMKKPGFYKPLSLNFLLFTSYHLSGKMAYTVYAIEMMKKITGDESTAHIGVLVLDGFSVFGMYVGCGLSKFLNRRTLLLVTSTIATVLLFIMSLYLYLTKLSLISDNDTITIIILTMYSLAICVGPMIVSTSICGELLPIKCRSFCVCIFGMFCAIVLGVLIKVSPYMFGAFGFHGTYLFFGVGSLVSLVLIYMYVPETRGKTLLEITAIFEENNSKEVVHPPLRNSLLLHS